MYISEKIFYVGVNDKTIDLFESQYSVPNGVSYNSYVIMDQKIAIMDTVDGRGTEQWLANIKEILNGKTPDYLVVSHMEPDHGANVARLCNIYPDMKLVGNVKTFGMIPQFYEIDSLEERKVVVAEGSELNLGSHTLVFYMAPMVHWPEVMVTYEKTEKILFSADGFGKFGALDVEEPWEYEAARYYLNIVGKYGVQVQALLKKAAALDIKMICPLHGPVLKENLGYYIEKYSRWSSYEPEEQGVVIAYASIHGNTKNAALRMAEILREEVGEKVITRDLSRDDMSEIISKAFYYDKMILACATYDGGLFPPMEDFLHHLKSKGLQKRKIGIVENGSWGPMAAKSIKALLEGFRDIDIVEPTVTIKSVMKNSDVEKMKELAQEMK